MCRYNQLWGFTLMAFGFGVLVGLWLSGGFLCYCFGLCLLGLGFCVLRRKIW